MLRMMRRGPGRQGEDEVGEALAARATSGKGASDSINADMPRGA
jgi:hypothetical protein